MVIFKCNWWGWKIVPNETKSWHWDLFCSHLNDGHAIAVSSQQSNKIKTLPIFKDISPFPKIYLILQCYKNYRYEFIQMTKTNTVDCRMIQFLKLPPKWKGNNWFLKMIANTWKVKTWGKLKRKLVWTKNSSSCTKEYVLQVLPVLQRKRLQKCGPSFPCSNVE